MTSVGIARSLPKGHADVYLRRLRTDGATRDICSVRHSVHNNPTQTGLKLAGAATTRKVFQRSSLKIASKSLSYIEPVFRPPAEWQSLVIQVTVGCSWNRCTFCEMYTAPQKQYRAKALGELESELAALARSMEGGQSPSRVFLADGDAMTLPFGHLKAVCEMVRAHFPSVGRISSYCLPRNLQGKTAAQLAELRALGLTILYVGCESGDDEVLHSSITNVS